jgi:hypothetical protein
MKEKFIAESNMNNSTLVRDMKHETHFVFVSLINTKFNK